jgi:hypothetical protein
VSGQLRTPAAFSPSPRYPLNRRPGGPQNRYGRCGEYKHFLPLPGTELGYRARNPSLYRPSYPGSDGTDWVMHHVYSAVEEGMPLVATTHERRTRPVRISSRGGSYIAVGACSSTREQVAVQWWRECEWSVGVVRRFEWSCVLPMIRC